MGGLLRMYGRPKISRQKCDGMIEVTRGQATWPSLPINADGAGSAFSAMGLVRGVRPAVLKSLPQNHPTLSCSPEKLAIRNIDGVLIFMQGFS